MLRSIKWRGLWQGCSSLLRFRCLFTTVSVNVLPCSPSVRPSVRLLRARAPFGRGRANSVTVVVKSREPWLPPLHPPLLAACACRAVDSGKPPSAVLPTGAPAVYRPHSAHGAHLQHRVLVGAAVQGAGTYSVVCLYGGWLVAEVCVVVSAWLWWPGRPVVIVP